MFEGLFLMIPPIMADGKKGGCIFQVFICWQHVILWASVSRKGQIKRQLEASVLLLRAGEMGSVLKVPGPAQLSHYTTFPIFCLYLCQRSLSCCTLSLPAVSLPGLEGLVLSLCLSIRVCRQMPVLHCLVTAPAHLPGDQMNTKNYRKTSSKSTKQVAL